MNYKVLEVNVDDRGRSGVYSLITNVIKNKPEDISIDIAAFETFESSNNIARLKELGTNVKYVGYKGSKLLKQYMIYRNLSEYLSNNKYDCVHVHSDVANKLLIAGIAARKNGVKKIIFHSHASEVDGNFRKIKRLLHKISRNKLKKIGTEFVACSDVAAKWMYPNISTSDIEIINNGINLKKYSINDNVRNEVREELGIKGKFVVGHVGRFSYQKNHEYLIKVFKEILKSKKDAYLLLIGEGPELNKIKDIVKTSGIEKNVIFYGLSDHVEKLLQIMDVFVLPSHFEGLPIVGVEAQAAGLPVIFSDKITKTAQLTKNVAFLPIGENDINNWANKILVFGNKKRVDNYSELKAKKFDIKDTLDQFIDLYK
ncbi:glycosyltransferase [Lactobacillus johnsonii]|uniref:glycosyltransferase n=1 Tax=Lactobacillus johnsonii TaxID=33959 RepID=UPI002B25F1DF|nr:glycosyltransferase [Lactobacillus johnsonii]